ncbi:MAG: hydrolase [Thermoleophilia bacterium]|nr:hydrolase [Thermoleophilia bacterium]
MPSFTGTLTWISHATVLLETGGGTRILVDGFIDSSPTTPEAFKADGVGDLDAIFVTHGHGDHLADVVAHQQRTGATVYAIVELADWFARNGVPEDHTVGFNKGGTVTVGDARITMVDARHSSATPDGAYAGEAAGFVFRLDDGFSFYHAGDTSVFGDMALIGELYQPSLAFLPIGDFYVMGEREAVKAVELLGVREVVGIHWGTFPPLVGRPAKFAELLGSRATVHQLEPGDVVPIGAAALSAH